MPINKKIILAVIGGLLATVTAAQALLITRLWDPSWNLYRPSPEQLLSKALENSKDIDASKIDARFNLDFQRDNQSIFSVETNVASETNRTNLDNPRSQGQLNGTISFEGAQLSFDAAYKLVDEKLYLNIATFPFLSYLELFLGGERVRNLRGQWIEFDIAEALEEQSEDVPDQLEQELQQKIGQLVRDGQLFQQIEQLPDETIRGKATYHFRISLKRSGLQELLNVIIEKKAAPRQKDALSPYIPYVPPAKSFEQQMSELLDQLGDVPIEVWIEKRDLLPYRIVIAKQFPADAFPSEVPVQFDSAHVFLQIDFAIFDTPVNIVAPKNSKTLEEIFQESPSPFGKARSSARDARRQSDIQQIRIAMELYYNDHQQYPSSSIVPASIIGDILPSFPADPGSGICADYQWISNISNPQSYCVYACLEDGEFFVASPTGTFELPVPPPSLIACES